MYKRKASHKLILQALEDKPLAEPVAALNTLFNKSYQRWYQSLYQGKYHYLGDAQLMNAAFLMDLASYFIGPVRLVYEDPDTEFALLPYSGPAGALFARFIPLLKPPPPPTPPPARPARPLARATAPPARPGLSQAPTTRLITPGQRR